MRTASFAVLVQPQILADAGLDCKTMFDPNESDTRGKAQAPKKKPSNDSAIKIITFILLVLLLARGR